MDKLGVLKEYFGHSAFREGQAEMIDAVLSGRDAFGVMPTSAGKSVCYQIPAIMSAGSAIVISPLISLMKDQVNSLIQSGVRAAYLNSSLTPQQYDTALANAARGAYKLIYVAPERLCTPSFLSFAMNAQISLVAVDEAHCVSQWGQDFRPSYLNIRDFVSRLPVRPPVAAFTATATPQVKEDIRSMLALSDPFEITTGFDRKNLTFSVVRASDKFAETLDVIKRNKDRPGIIYCSTRKTVEEVCAKLQAKGYSCGRYHAGLSDEERRLTQDAFTNDRIQYITATNAFGMGIDKTNVGFVLHYNCPKDIESYYQEAGRAGRDGEKAECVLLYSPRDTKMAEFLISQSDYDSDMDEETAAALRERDRERLRRMTLYCTTTDCLREYILKYFGEKCPSYCGNCSNCLTGFEDTDVTDEARKILSCVYRVKEHRSPVGASTVTDILRGSKNERIISRGFDTISTYGIMSDVPAHHIRRIIDRLIADGCIRTDGEYNVLVLTNRARGLLFNGEKLVMKFPKTVRKSRREKVGDSIYSLDSALFGRLKKLRSQLAAENHVPAYIIFSDSSLRDICVKCPSTKEELLECSGIGRAKADRYGSRITEVIKQYTKENGSPRDTSLLDRMQASRSAGDGSMLFRLIRFNRGKLTPAKEPLSLSQFCDRILEQLGISADKARIRDAIDGWLLNNDYLSCGTGGKGFALTILSQEAGLTELTKLGRDGKEYKSIVLTPDGQEYIIMNTDDIFSDGGDRK